MEKSFYEGSVKNLFRRESGTFDATHTDYFSVFDVGRHRQSIPGKGRAICDCALQTFRIAEALGIRTHFVRQVDDCTLRFREFATPSVGVVGQKGFVIPLEFLSRSLVAGSIWRDFAKNSGEEGKLYPSEFGFPTDDLPKVGTPFPSPVTQITTKREKVDRRLSPVDARQIGGITDNQLQAIWSAIHRLDAAVSIVCHQAGFRRVDGKKEFAIDHDGQVCLVDSAGTLDEDRFFPTAELEKGEVVNFSKEILREFFIKNGYFARLQEARKSSEPDPVYPDLAPDQIDLCSSRYRIFAGAYGNIVIPTQQ